MDLPLHANAQLCLALRRLLSLLEEVRAEFGQDLPTQTLRVFIDIALHPNTHMTAVAERLSMGKSSTSRNVSALTEYTWLRQPGPGLVEVFEDPNERRIKRLRLTPQGVAVAERLATSLFPSPD
jgi:DNA-binding MarR family transcriptional regulator